MVKQIYTLCGNIFEATSRYRLYLDFPHFRAKQISMTYNRDRLGTYFTGLGFCLVNLNNGKKWYGVTWLQHMDMYLCIELNHIKYEQFLDIKYEWKYRKELQAWLKKNT